MIREILAKGVNFKYVKLINKRIGRRVIGKYYMVLESRNDATKRKEKRNNELVE